jgi:hypothetical protein
MSGTVSSCCHKAKNEDFPEYEGWKKRRARCSKPRQEGFENYGGRGIKHHPAWENFKVFYRDMGPRPSPLHQCDRNDNDGNYCPENCSWELPATHKGERRVSRRRKPTTTAVHDAAGNFATTSGASETPVQVTVNPAPIEAPRVQRQRKVKPKPITPGPLLYPFYFSIRCSGLRVW